MNYYLLFVVPALLISVIAQINVQTTFSKYNSYSSLSGYTGAMAARRILDENGLQNVEIQRVSGKLTDHFDPRSNVIRLSDSTYGSDSVGAIGVAVHEVGHALQYQQGYLPIKMRNLLLPVTNLGSQLAFPLAFLGLIMGFDPLVNIGILLFEAVVAFQLITLPVEFNASRRALAAIEGSGILSGDGLDGAKKVLSAAAMTYVASLIVAMANLLRLLAMRDRRNR